MKVSIITVVYNGASTIRQTLESVLSQRGVDLEYILIDGASTDGTTEILQSYRHRIDTLVSEPDGGLYDAMNKGLALATGEYIGTLNADDFYPGEDILQNVVRKLEATGADSLYGDLKYVDQENTAKVVRNWQAGLFRHDSFLYGWMPPHPTFFARKQVYERWGGFRTELRTAADYELMLRLLYKHRISTCYLPQTLVHMRTGGVSNQTVTARWRANREDRRAWDMNALRPRPYTLLLKPLRKVVQFLER
ncbi:Glycosyltransferase involved in cell wall bisynthesis [Catalinimonas alkaloidigena]|uniref:Glycosyltransferase involved in cell wall bisynthesis n=1 Tax=Catalinimonas alkaloidigena TaxID=1075417 RepID=A0A1G9LGF1_9BACT|nr:glycosyltransferase family 2 protein [Catalinimonas alkaloidigena]SDL60575.1 Glycosyltransferase involved in cell wall bisynthesis [Catalinimonas alkaloidigena]